MKIRSIIFLWLIIFAVACSDDEPELDPPVITYSGGDIDALPGETVTITVGLSSGAGLATLEISQDTGNGAVLLDEVTLDPTLMQINFEASFDIPGNFPTGTTIVVIFELIDTSNRRSSPLSVTVNVN